MLASVGADVEWVDHTMVIDPSMMRSSHVPTPHSGSNRIPILLLGALLHRWNEVFVPVLGGCKIGARGVEFHLAAIRAFGGIVEETDDGFVARRYGNLSGAQIQLPYPSVGATETCLYLGVLAEGRTVITNAAMEPEIFELITMLRSMGAIIFTTPNREIRIDGVPALQGTNMPILGDRIEAASWACLACASDGDITVHGIRPENLGNFLSYYQLVGGGIELINANSIRFFRRGEIRPTMIETDVFPGFSTDWQQPFAILLTQAEGISVIHETVYEKRFGYLKALNKLGARTQLTTHCLGSLPCRYLDKGYPHSAIITGPTPFHAADEIEIPDLRAGLAYVIAAAIAPGETLVTGIPFLERGYGDIVPRLAAMNLHIEKVTLPQRELA
jgi:UDP-N-acetylglucosamine 1-carboxyvinyltransferase